MPNCPTCGTLLADRTRKLDVCPDCAKRLGLVEMPPNTRTARPCAKCNSLKFLRVIPREHTGDSDLQHSAPMVVTHTPRSEIGFLGDSARAVDIRAGHGRLEMFLCYDCGAAEWYCPDVKSIPVGSRFMTELVEYDAGGGPYRS